jgi:hypothetical protein
MIKRSFLLLMLTMLLALGTQAQYGIQEYEVRGMNIIKANLTGLLFRSYGGQFERVINRRISLGLSYRNMPEGPIPFKNAVINQVGDGDQETIDQINSLRVKSMAITPEVRFYLGKKGFGNGFYLAPFYRYATHEASNISVDYQGTGGANQIDMSGKLTSNTGGLLIGAQWTLGEKIVLDWWILGPHYGGGNGDLRGVATTPLSPSEQADLQNELENLAYPFGIKATVSVNANGALVQMKGPVAGVRAGIMLGFRF